MRDSLRSTVIFLLLSACAVSVAFAQDTSGDTAGSSQQVESSDDAYRRRMELEDARRKDPSYTDPIDTYHKDQEKIDTLPKESRETIRDQLLNVIVKNGEWEPADALDDYPYTPSEAAGQDPELEKQEQEAWDEQIEKYHEREAAAFGAHRGPVPGPGNPDGQEGGQDGSHQGQGGQGGSQKNSQAGSAGGTYEYQSNGGDSNDEASTAGVSESALDFLKGRQSQSGQAQNPDQAGAPPRGSGESSSSQGSRQSAAQWAQQAEAAQQKGQTEQSESEQRQEAEPEQAEQERLAQSESQSQQQESERQDSEANSQAEIELDQRGIIAIKDLNKLEGAEIAPENDGSR